MKHNDIRICEKCRHISLKTIVPTLEKMVKDTTVRIGCKSYCGPCRKSAFVYVNGRYVTAPTEQEVVEAAKKYIK